MPMISMTYNRYVYQWNRLIPHIYGHLAFNNVPPNIHTVEKSVSSTNGAG